MIVSNQPTLQIFKKLKNSGRPYLIAGSQASYQYHRWLSLKAILDESKKRGLNVFVIGAFCVKAYDCLIRESHDLYNVS